MASVYLVRPVHLLPAELLGLLSNPFWCTPLVMQCFIFAYRDALPLTPEIPAVAPTIGEEDSALSHTSLDDNE